MSRKYREILNKTQYLFNHQNLCCHLQRTPRLHTLGWSNRQILDNLQIEDPLYLMVCITYFREYRLLRSRLTNLVMLTYVWNRLSSEKINVFHFSESISKYAEHHFSGFEYVAPIKMVYAMPFFRKVHHCEGICWWHIQTLFVRYYSWQPPHLP